MAKSTKSTPSLPMSSRMQMPGMKTPIEKVAKKSVAKAAKSVAKVAKKSVSAKVMSAAKKKGMTSAKKGMY